MSWFGSSTKFRSQGETPRNRLFDSGFSIFDSVLEEIASTVGQLPAESGGALLGLYSSQTVVRFVFDPAATTTGASYVPSAQLTSDVQQLEVAGRLQFNGVVHSHPGALDSPSGPDHHSFGLGLEANPELGRYLAPIITFTPGRVAANKLTLGHNMWASFYVAFRSRSGLRVEPCIPRVIHFVRDCRLLAAEIGAPPPRVQSAPLNEQFAVTADIDLPDGTSLTLAASSGYPEVAPLALWFDPGRNVTKQLVLPWMIMEAPEERLVRSFGWAPLGDLIRPLKVRYGRRGSTQTDDPVLAARLELEPMVTSADDEAHRRAVQDGLLARSKGLITDQIRAAHVVIAGCGSVGSYAAEQLARCGVERFTLIDPDLVEYSNLSRAVYRAVDVGRPKALALAQRLLEINPEVTVVPVVERLQEIDPAEIESIFSSATVVFSALDDRRAQLQINQWAYWHRVGAVYVGLFAGAKAGEVCVVHPPGPCFSCATGFRQILSAEVQGEGDYGTGRLTAEIALGVDIQSVAAIGVRLALSSLMRDTGSPLEEFAQRALDQHSYAIMAVSDQFDVVDELMRDVPAQYSHRSVWLTVTKGEECNVCGGQADQPRVDRTPALEDILRADAETVVEPSVVIPEQ